MEILAMEIRVGAVKRGFYRLDNPRWWQPAGGTAAASATPRATAGCRRCRIDRIDEADVRLPSIARPTGVGRPLD
jgi:hypothetical protein